jgi:hypothetical protein
VNDVSAAGPGTQAHKAGAPVIVMNVVATEEYGDLVFSAPSASAIALMRAIDSAAAAIQAKTGIEFKDSVFLGKPQTRIDNDVALFDLIDNFFVSAIFSFLAIEAFANEVMDGAPNELIPKRTTNAKGQPITLQLPAKSLDRESTEFKLDIALPQKIWRSPAQKVVQSGGSLFISSEPEMKWFMPRGRTSRPARLIRQIVEKQTCTIVR